MLDIKKKAEQYFKVQIDPDISCLTGNDKKVIKLLIKATDEMTKIYLRQMQENNLQWLKELEEGKIGNKDILHFFKINNGPYDEFREHEKFLEQAPDYFKGANYYPQDMTKEEFEAWLEAHPEDKEAFTSEFSVIRRDGDKLISVPYSVCFKEQIDKASAYLKEAAEYADNASLKDFLVKRSADLLNDNYYDSDVAWMKLENNLVEPTCGPYEVYSDYLFSYKAAFESFITIKDQVASDKLDRFKEYLEELDNSLPLDPKYKTRKRPQDAPMVVVNLLYAGGEANNCGKAIAFNLPNDEKVRSELGGKKTMMKNVMEAKANAILKPIGQAILSESEQEFIDGEMFFYRVLFHEIGHSMGPGIMLNEKGEEISVYKSLKELHNTMEEAKADLFAFFAMDWCINKGLFDESCRQSLWITNIPDLIRTVRKGVNEAHGASNLMQFNYFKENGALIYDEEKKKYTVDLSKAFEVSKNALAEILDLQASCDYDKTKEFIAKYTEKDPHLFEMIDSLQDIPMDIEYEFVGVGKLG
ncbi:MAG: peptidase [Pseudomonadota bacterium]